MKPLAPNTLLQNRYLIVQLIGKGGMGEVYLAVDQRLGSAVALKRTLFSDDENLGNAFEREAKTLARLRHPVLPKVSDHFIENEMQYLVMEHIGGDDLAKRLEISKKPFPLEWVLFWTDQLLDALAYLHAHEPPIVHRDIKPQNLKLTSENHVVLLDFGLAKNSFGNTFLTTTGRSIIGYTPHYAPMEQIRGAGGANPRSDIYSLSATVYQLLTDIVPPDALTRADAVLSGLPDPVKSPSEINPQVSVKVSEIILKGMALGSEHRYPNARQMQEDLRAAHAAIQNPLSAQQSAALRMPSVETLPAAIQDSSAAANLDAPANNAVLNDAVKTNSAKNEIPFGAQQKSGGKSLAATAGIGVFAALGAAAIGWYALKSPEMKPAPNSAPRAEVTAEPVKNAINAADNSAASSTPIDNANSEAGNSSAKTVSAPPLNVQPAIKPAPPRNSPLAQKKPATVKTPARINRTDILQ